MMMPNLRREIDEVLRRLTEAHAQAASCAHALRALLAELTAQPADCASRGAKRGGVHLTLADRSSFSVVWNGRSCYLGRSLMFRLFERLARGVNQYITYEQLLREVWEAPRSNEAVRSVVRDLRRRLRNAGMGDLAEAIDGRNRECYGLILDRDQQQFPTEIPQQPPGLSHGGA